jgi:Na+-transporting methylmalonyl-CoA/oxaloacetate decarboxylase gamma subunit
MKSRVYSFGGSNGLIGLVGTILFLVAVYYVLKFSFIALYYAAPVLLGITLFINYKVVTDYLSSLWTRIQQNPVAGVLNVVLSVLGAPVVILFLFGKALLFRRLGKFQEQFQGQFNENFNPTQQANTSKRSLNTKDDFVEYEEVKE